MQLPRFTTRRWLTAVICIAVLCVISKYLYYSHCLRIYSQKLNYYIDLEARSSQDTIYYQGQAEKLTERAARSASKVNRKLELLRLLRGRSPSNIDPGISGEPDFQDNSLQSFTERTLELDSRLAADETRQVLELQVKADLAEKSRKEASKEIKRYRNLINKYK